MTAPEFVFWALFAGWGVGAMVWGIIAGIVRIAAGKPKKDPIDKLAKTKGGKGEKKVSKGWMSLGKNWDPYGFKAQSGAFKGEIVDRYVKPTYEAIDKIIKVEATLTRSEELSLGLKVKSFLEIVAAYQLLIQAEPEDTDFQTASKRIVLSVEEALEKYVNYRSWQSADRDNKNIAQEAIAPVMKGIDEASSKLKSLYRDKSKNKLTNLSVELAVLQDVVRR